MNRKYTREELVIMNKEEIKQVFLNGHPLNIKELENTQYFGIDISMPAWFHKYFWKTFRKAFYRDPESGILRGWNVKMEQLGIDGLHVPKKNKDGSDMTFAHYHVQSAEGLRFPRKWNGSYFLNYNASPNKFGEGAAYTPLVAVNKDDMSLLLGWEVFKLGPFFIVLDDYWLLVYEGPLEKVVAVPK